MRESGVQIACRWGWGGDFCTHYGVSQSDLYQMAVYQYKYHAQNVTLLYPRSGSIDSSKPVSFTSKDGLTVHLRWIDLLDAKQSIAAFAETFAH